MKMLKLSLVHLELRISSGELVVVLDEMHLLAQWLVMLLKIGVEGEQRLVSICESSFCKSFFLKSSFERNLKQFKQTLASSFAALAAALASFLACLAAARRALAISRLFCRQVSRSDSFHSLLSALACFSSVLFLILLYYKYDFKNQKE